MGQALRGIFWICVYAAAVVAPLAVGGARSGLGFARDFSVALGFIGLMVMALQFGLVARLQRVTAPFGMDALLQYHRQIGFAALAMVVAHPIILFVDDPDKLALLDWPDAPNRARFAVSALVALALLIATSVWRKQLRLSYEAWQALHGVLSVAVVALSLLHMVGVDYYLDHPFQRALWIAVGGVVVGLIAWRHVARPIAYRRRPWVVDETRAERGDAWTLSMRPDGHDGMSFRPGQFGWVMVGGSPFALGQHPFSFSSSAERSDRVEMTIKARGDFTRTIAQVEPGTRCYIDGPYGLFTPDLHEGPGFVLIGGGVGITPLMSMLRTMADREDVRPCVLFYGSADYESATFRDELDELSKRLALTVVHVIERPHDGWDGEVGFIHAALVRRHLPGRFERYRYFVCGPIPMMDAMERVLHEVGVPGEHVHTERFDMV
jgi:predicted ferric reductase